MKGKKFVIRGYVAVMTDSLIEEIKSCGGVVDENGCVTLYHITSEKNASSIIKTGVMIAKEDGIFFSTKPDGQASGYGNTALKFKIPAKKLELDDIFDDEAHLRIPLKNKHQTLNIREYLQNEEE